jgi:hypothetical protein
VITTQVYETIYDLFWWEDGIFNFDLKLVESYKKIPFALSTEQVLLNILRMVDEGSEIEKKIYSPHLVFQKVLDLDRKPAESLTSPSYLKEKLTSEQDLVYQLVDGERTVEEIIDRSLLGRFNTSEILNGLLEMGLIEVLGVHTPGLVKKASKINPREILGYACYGGVLLLLILVFIYFKPGFLHHVRDSRIASVNIEIPTNLAHRTQLQRLKNALEIYYLERGQYPGRLEELVSVKLLKEEDLFYRKGISFQYERKDGTYVLKR